MAQKIVAIIQARMGSTRLPGKVLRRLGRTTALEHALQRLRNVRGLDEIVVATTVLEEDNAISAACAALGVTVVRGSVSDVLDRYRFAAEQSAADVIVRITADCPLIDPEVIDRIIECSAGADYTSNTMERTYPRGLDAEVFTRAALETAAREATEGFEREHVTPFFHRHPERFSSSTVRRDGESLAGWRWTLDERLDADFFDTLFANVGELLATDFSHNWLVDYLSLRPEIIAINTSVEQREFDAHATLRSAGGR